MVLSDLWMTLQKVEAAGHGDYIVNFAGDLCFMERNLAVIEENLFNTRAVGIKMGAEFGDTVSVFCSKIEAFVKLHPSAADLYVMTVSSIDCTNRAHRLGMRISRVCAWGTSALAYDGSGRVLRGKDAGFNTFEICKFPNGKVYNCDLSASYNIGARYFIRKILKSLDENSRLRIEAKIPQCSKRSTCTFSTLINLNAELMSIAA